MPDYYRILEVDPEASKEVIEKAFRALSLKYHPDTAAIERKEDAESRWLEVRKAYEVLSDDARRKTYDASRKRQMLDLFLSDGIIGLARRYFR